VGRGSEGHAGEAALLRETLASVEIHFWVVRAIGGAWGGSRVKADDVRSEIYHREWSSHQSEEELERESGLLGTDELETWVWTRREPDTLDAIIMIAMTRMLTLRLRVGGNFTITCMCHWDESMILGVRVSTTRALLRIRWTH